MNDVEIYTTPTIEGRRIREYKGLVVARNVRAVNIVRDLFTAIRDVFGGRSGSYEKVMRDIQEQAVAEIKEEARQRGANAIVGFRLDFDNISSKGTSLLMATASGTAVLVE